MSFLRYVEGSIPGKKLKRPASADERQVTKTSIKNPGKENFFLKDRSWLAYDEDKQLMFCNWCKNHKVDSVLVKGTNKFKLDVVKQHESSKPHQYYQSRYISNPTEPTESTAAQCLLKLKQNDFDNLSVRFRNGQCTFCCKVS